MQYDHKCKHNLSDLENCGQELCKEHARVLHQIEHITWHLEGCTRHRPCMGRPTEPCHKKSVAPSNASCVSSSAPTCNRPSALVRVFIHLSFHSFDRSPQIHFSSSIYCVTWNCITKGSFLPGKFEGNFRASDKKYCRFTKENLRCTGEVG